MHTELLTVKTASGVVKKNDFKELKWISFSDYIPEENSKILIREKSGKTTLFDYIFHNPIDIDYFNEYCKDFIYIN